MTGESSPPDEPAPIPLEPRDGIPEVTCTPEGLDAAIAAIDAGTGPVAIDAERASGFRYGQRAYLVQIRREGSGTCLIDPIALPDLTAVNAAIGDAEWVVHAASQDLPCLAELGMAPHSLFDTELAGRLLGRPRVGLGPLVSAELGHHLEKGHGAADWSTRPLPEAWLRYAALDVEVLLELRDLLEADLVATGKIEWARAEFEAVRTAPPPPPRTDPWRRTSGIHRIRRPRGLAIVRELWNTRDRIAERADISPGRILPDRSIVAAAAAVPATREALAELPEFTGRGARRRLTTWWEAVAAAGSLPEEDLPLPQAPGDQPPPARAWRDRDPAAAARLDAARAAVSALAEDRDLPAENLLSPDLLRRLCWRDPGRLDAEAVAARLTALGARPWQVQIVAQAVAEALAVVAARASDTD